MESRFLFFFSPRQAEVWGGAGGRWRLRRAPRCLHPCGQGSCCASPPPQITSSIQEHPPSIPLGSGTTGGWGVRGDLWGRGWAKPALEAVGGGQEVPLLQDVHLVLGVLQQEGAGGALAGLGAGPLGQLGLGGALPPALLAPSPFGVVLGFPQLLFVLHPPVLEPGFHLGEESARRI